MPVAVDSYARTAAPSHLEGLVEHVWVARHRGGRTHHEVLLPDGRGLLQVVRGTAGTRLDPLTGARVPDVDGLRGPWTRAELAEQSGPVARLGVQLHPLGAARLRGGRPVADTWLPLPDVLPVAVVARAGELLDAHRDAEAVAVCLEAVAASPRHDDADLDRLDEALAFVDAHRGLVRAADVARAVGTSLGELHRWCVTRLGTTPAQHLAAVRFTGFVREAVGAGPVDAADVVAAVEWFVGSGYPPREVERTTGMPPAELRRLAERLAHRLGLPAAAL
ncbi:hypothetical protein [Cellulomonas oligotrophica]|uniref:HTH araC/xylS-type domain-containing protein n=1 Tax=Cellulomonas oligotrophica TaxID=931536 RepID=A0A7Y9FIW5_9CELL|nr:hypothetical protein [Cellulomonas oligotrophica]NYD88163.1 hypothetical protein [Cellulomonas oligotrophica]GIG33671.1 hypothetical protein Col01nite_28300 [Cellulomonas oligotrophica]